MENNPRMEFRLSRHAEEEMVRRQISRQLVESVLENPEQRLAEPGGKQIFQSRYRSEDGRMYLLRAIVNMLREPAVVVTLYRTSKIDKYWSQNES
jgi:hypothetical protein